jgi:RNA polymerase sigma-70 factor (ECF subfamily)
VNAAAGIVVAPGGRLFAVMMFATKDEKIVDIDIIADPARLSQLDLTILDD